MTLLTFIFGGDYSVICLKRGGSHPKLPNILGKSDEPHKVIHSKAFQ